MIKRTSRLFVRMVVYGGIALLIACAGFLYRGQQRLIDLVSHTSRKRPMYTVRGWISTRAHLFPGTT